MDSLTYTQKRLLRAMVDGHAIPGFPPGTGYHYYDMFGGSWTTATNDDLAALITSGCLHEETVDEQGRMTYRLTEAGRAALLESEGSDRA